MRSQQKGTCLLVQWSSASLWTT